MTEPAVRDRYDVVIAGARCAGASTAMLLARAGLDVLVVDPLPRGRDTLSTHALMRGGVMQLARWGLLDRLKEAGTPVVRTTTFYYGAQVIPIPIKVADGIDGLYAPRRTVLDPILAGAAEAAGATVVHGLSVSDLVRDGDGRVRGVVLSGPDGSARTVSADLVVGADGVRSRVARLVEARTLFDAPNTAASIYGHWPGLGVRDYHWFFGLGVAGGTIPTNDGHTCVFASVPPHRFRTERSDGLLDLYLDTLAVMAPDLSRRLAAEPDAVRLRAFPGAPGFIKDSVGPGWALVGDAGFFRDPLTAHGITDALRDAELLASVVAEGSEAAMADYQEVRVELTRPLLEVTDRVASFDWDLEEVQEAHLALSRHMNAGVDLMRERSPADAVVTAGAG